jgi:acetyl esterase/lipase
MPDALRYAAQALFYAGFAAAIGVFASWPVYYQAPPGSAQIKLSFNHGGARVEECRKLTAEELAKLPSAQRRPVNCSRERLPVVIRLTIDGKPLYDAVLQPSGLSRDGQARAYEKFIVPAGKHVIEARLRDSKRSEGFDYESRFEAELAPWQNLAIDFKAEQGGFLFR